MRLAIVLLGLGGAVAACASVPVQSTEAPDPAAALVAAKCSTCHPLTMVTDMRKTRAEWEASLDAMIGRGMEASDAEFEAMTDYLARTYGAAAS